MTDFKGRVSKIESLGAVDGGGIRYVIFMHGCPLNCIYCHNPEIAFSSSGYREFTVSELFSKIMRVSPYFSSGGGVSASGGEPLLQAEFLLELFKMLKTEGVSTALDTSGAILNDNVRELLKYTDLLLIDLKFYDNDDYEKYTGGSLFATLDFLREWTNLATACASKKTLVRTVIVPGLNDKGEDIMRYAELAKAAIACDFTYELLAFHTMGFGKYEKIGRKNPLIGMEALPPQKIDELNIILKQSLEKR